MQQNRQIVKESAKSVRSNIGVILGGYEGYAYPHFLEWGYRTPHFLRAVTRSEPTVSPSGNTLETSAGGSSYVMWSWALIQQLTAAENMAEKYNDAKETQPRCSMQCASWLHRSVEFEGHRKYVCELQRTPTAAIWELLSLMDITVNTQLTL